MCDDSVRALVGIDVKYAVTLMADELPGKPTWKLHHKFSARFRDEILGIAWFQVMKILGMV
jgi:hypothetical protein